MPEHKAKDVFEAALSIAPRIAAETAEPAVESIPSKHSIPRSPAKKTPRAPTEGSLSSESSPTKGKLHYGKAATIHFRCAEEENSLLEDLGMAMPRAHLSNLDQSQVLSGDLSVLHAADRRASGSKSSPRRGSDHGSKSSSPRKSISQASPRKSFSQAGSTELGKELSRRGSKDPARITVPDRHPELACGIARQNLLAEASRSEEHKPELAAAVITGVSPSSPSHSKPRGLSLMKKSAMKVMHISKLAGAGKDAKGKKMNSDRMMIVQELITLPIFKWCHNSLLNELAAGMEEKNLLPGMILRGLNSCYSLVPLPPEFRDTPDPHMIIVTRGTMQVVIDDHEVLKLGDSQYFGETVLLGLQQEWGATLKVEASTAAMVLYRREFIKALHFFQTEKNLFETLQKEQQEHLTDGTLVKPCTIFKGLPESSIASLHKNILTRVYFPGQQILEEGRPGDEMYMLVRGIVGVEIMGRVVRQERRDSETIRLHTDDSQAQAGEQPICFGEMGLLGMQQVRSATVVAQTVCHLRVLYRSVFLSTLSRSGESIRADDMVELLNKRYKDYKKPAISVLRGVSIFQQVGCSDEFLDFLAKHLEERIFLVGQKIIDETCPEDRCMYLLGEGVAKVVKHNQEVATLTNGAVFGEIIVLGLASKRTATVVAAETCYMQVLHQGIVVKGLELFPEERQKVLMMAFAKSGDVNLAEALAPAAEQALKKSSLFAGINPGFAEDLGAVAHDRIYMPGDLIMEEGMRGDSMFIMVSGQAVVFATDVDTIGDKQVAAFLADQQHGMAPRRGGPGATSQLPSLTRGPNASDEEVRDGPPRKGSMTSYGSPKSRRASTGPAKKVMSRIGLLTAGSISGELAMLGVALIRSATIEAQTICSMWEITQQKALAILDNHPDAQSRFANLIVEHLERTVPARVMQTPLFRGFDRKFLTFLGLHCQRKAYFPGQNITREGQSGDRLFIVNQGRAALMKKSVTVKTVASGSYFGSEVMLGIQKVYLGTLVALQTCHVLVISRKCFHQALEQYPSLMVVQELRKTEKVACEELCEAIQRISARKLILKRYQRLILDTQYPDANNPLNQKDLLERAMQIWRDWAKRVVQKRKQLEQQRRQYKEMMDQWVQKRMDRREMVRVKSEDQLHVPGCKTPRKKELVKVLEDWPAPRPSPHYRLRVFGVLHEAVVKQPVQGAPLLPLLKEHQVQSFSGKSARIAKASSPSAEKRGEEARGYEDGSDFLHGDESLIEFSDGTDDFSDASIEGDKFNIGA